MKREIWRANWLGLVVLVIPEAAYSSDLIEFTNKVASFTNLQGEAFNQVSLVRGDLDGVIWRNGPNGGRVCYTNLHASFLQDWGIPTNRIDSARARAQQRQLADARDRAITAQAAYALAMAKAHEAADWEAGAAARALQKQRETDREAIDTMELKIESAKSLMRKAQAIAHDYTKANSLNRSAPRLYILETERVKIKEAEVQLKKMKKDYALKYGKT